MGMNKKRVFVIAALVAITLALIGSTTVALAVKWNGHFTGGEAATVAVSRGEGPVLGTLITFRFEGKVDLLEPSVRPPPPPGLAASEAPGATILGRATWVDHSVTPPRRFHLHTPVAYDCGLSFTNTRLWGIGTDSTKPGTPVLIRLVGDDPTSGEAETVKLFVYDPIPPSIPHGGPPSPRPYYFASGPVTGGQVVMHSCQLS